MSYTKLTKALGASNVRDILRQAAPDAPDQIKTWRGALRNELGPRGERLWPMLVRMANGTPFQVTLPDGRLSAPIMPTPAVMLQAQIFLAEFQFGKAVPQTEIQKAESEATEMEAIRAMTDEQLEAEARAILEARQVQRLPAGPVTEAVFTVEQLDAYEIGEVIFDSKEEED